MVYNSQMPFAESASSHHKPKSPPPDSTNQEAAHLKELVDQKKPVSIKMVDGEIVRGWIEYYDRNMLRLTRDGLPNLFIYKDQIAYVAEV
jgi:host factor-I protein